MNRWIVPWVLLLTTLAAGASAQPDEADLAHKQWVAFYDFRHASQTATCTVASLEAPLTVLLAEQNGERFHLVRFGNDVAIASRAWIRIDDRESRSFPAGIVPLDESFAVVSDMLLGAYAYIEWSSWPEKTIEEASSGLGFFAWSYTRCRAKLGWPVPESLERVLARRYEEGPSLEVADLPSRESLDREYEELFREFQRLKEELEGL